MDKRGREEVSPSKKKACLIETPTKLKRNGSNVVKVSNLPEVYLESGFKSSIERNRKKNGICPNESVTIVKCFNLSKEFRHVFVVFTTPEVASEIVKIPIVYYKHALHVEIYQDVKNAAHDDIHDEETNLNIVADQTLSNEVLLCDKSEILDLNMNNTYVNRDALYMCNDTINHNSRPSGSSTPFGKAAHQNLIAHGSSHSKTKRSLNEAFECSKFIVNFSGIDCYDEGQFHNFLSRGLSKKCNLQGELFTIGKYDEDKKTVDVEFKSEATAELVSEQLQFAEFMFSKLVLTVVKVPCDIKNRVKFRNIEDPFDEDQFRTFLEKGLSIKCHLWGKSIVHIEPFNVSEQSVVVKFRSSEIASVVFNKLQGASYMLENLSLVIVGAEPAEDATSLRNSVHNSHAEDATLTEKSVFNGDNDFNSFPDGFDDEEESEQDVQLKNSHFCQVINVQNSRYADLKNIIEAKMVQNELVSLGEKCIKTILPHDSNSVIVKFRTCEEANLATVLDGLCVGSNKLKIRKYLDGTVSGPSAVEGYIDITSDEGKVILLRGLIRLRDEFKVSGSLELPISRLQQCLLNHQVVVSASDLKQARRNLVETHRRHVREGKPVLKPCQVAFDNESVDLVRNTEYDPARDSCTADTLVSATNLSTPSEELSKYCKVASWSIPATKTLISICIENSEEFDEPVRHRNFWEAVSEAMAKEHFYYSWKQCESRMEFLIRKHKDFDDAGGHTGAASASLRGVTADEQSIMALMTQLLQENVTYRPKVTFSVGHKGSKLTMNSSVQEVSSSSQFRVGGRTRPVVLKGKKSRADRLVAAAEKKSDALWLMAHQKERKKKKKKRQMKRKHMKYNDISDESSDSSSSSDSSAAEDK